MLVLLTTSVGVTDNVENDIVLQCVVLCVHVHSLLACVCVSLCVCVCRMNVEPGSRVLQWTLMFRKRKQRVSCAYDIVIFAQSV